MTAGLAVRGRCLFSEHQFPDGLPVQATEGMLVLDAHGVEPLNAARVVVLTCIW